MTNSECLIDAGDLCCYSQEEQEQLLIEYRQWLLTVDLRQHFIQHFPIHDKKWLNNTFDRWLLSLHSSINNNYIYDCHFPLYPNGLSSTDAIHSILVKEIHSHLLLSSSPAATITMNSTINLMENYLKHISNHKKIIDLEKEILKISVSTRSISIRDGKIIEISSLTIGELQTRYCRRINVLVKKFGLKSTVAMILRYESLGSGSYQWGDPIELHEFYYKKFSVRYEGFASPLNSRLLGQKNAKFCSLFIDIDEIFGSLGNFMNIDLKKYSGGWCINPPFIDLLLENVVRKILNALDNSSGKAGCLYFFISMPFWNSSAAWILLHNSKYLVKYFNFNKCEYILQTPYEEPLNPNCPLSYFILGYLPNDTRKYIDEFENIMSTTYTQWKSALNNNNNDNNDLTYLS